jgi:hypothetical protein
MRAAMLCRSFSISPLAVICRRTCLSILLVCLALGTSGVAVGQDVMDAIFGLCSDRHSPGWWQCRMNCPTDGEACGLACNEMYLSEDAAKRSKRCAQRQGAAWGLMEEILIQVERMGRSDMDVVTSHGDDPRFLAGMTHASRAEWMQ